MRITKENTMGLAIDIQERLFPVMAEKESFLANSIKLIKGLELLHIPVTVTQQYTKGLGNTIEPIRSIIKNFNFLEKNDFSCYDDLDFAEKLKKSGTQNVIICGIESHVCVLQTAVDLKQAGYNPVVVADCVTSRSLVNYEFAMERFQHEQIMLSTYESILFELTRTSKSSVFKSISNLVK